MATNRWQKIVSRLLRKHRGAKSFEQETQVLGGISGGHDLGLKIVPVERIVGSVGRWQNLRSDFFYRKGDVTERFHRIGQAMRHGIDLPPIEVYKLKRKAEGEQSAAPSEYYVVDGHHRVAMARELGQDFLDANVKEFRGSADVSPSADAGDVSH